MQSLYKGSYYHFQTIKRSRTRSDDKKKKKKKHPDPILRNSVWDGLQEPCTPNTLNRNGRIYDFDVARSRSRSCNGLSLVVVRRLIFEDASTAYLHKRIMDSFRPAFRCHRTFRLLSRRAIVMTSCADYFSYSSCWRRSQIYIGFAELYFCIAG